MKSKTDNASHTDKKKPEFIEPKLTKHDSLVKNTLMPIGISGDNEIPE